MFFSGQPYKLPPQRSYFERQLARSNLQPPQTTTSLQLEICVVSLENCLPSFLGKLLFNLKLYFGVLSSCHAGTMRTTT